MWDISRMYKEASMVTDPYSVKSSTRQYSPISDPPLYTAMPLEIYMHFLKLDRVGPVDNRLFCYFSATCLHLFLILFCYFSSTFPSFVRTCLYFLPVSSCFFPFLPVSFSIFQFLPIFRVFFFQFLRFFPFLPVSSCFF